MIGTELEGRYRIEAELGKGGTGTVFRAVDLARGSIVAIKSLNPEWSSSTEIRQRFEREARALASLEHPHIVRIVDSFVAGSTAYLVMDLLEGETLSQRLRRGGGLPLSTALVLERELLLALSYVHEQGIVHRDVKPANVFLEVAGDGQDPSVRLLDFGLAKFVAPEAGDRVLTRAGQVFGTPSYMAPEQIAGQAADARADVYAAGIVLFEMLAGAPPFRGADSEILRQHVMEELPIALLPSAAATPPVVAFLKRATAKTRAERFASANEMLEALDPILEETFGTVLEPVTALETPDALLVGSNGVPMPASSAFGRFVFRIVAGASLLVSLGALAAVVHVGRIFFTPGHAQERRALEAALQLPPPKPPKGTHAGSAPAGSAKGTALAPSAPAAPRTAPAEPSAAPVERAEAVPAAAAEPPSLTPASSAIPPRPREPAPNPWSSVPSDLARLLGKVQRGKSLEKKDMLAVHQYNARHQTDPRGHLLLARGYSNRHWVKDAVAEYAIALEVSRDARGDPRMLPDLVKLYELGSSEAARLITETFADTARPAVSRALQSPPNPVVKERLERLLADLPEKPAP